MKITKKRVRNIDGHIIPGSDKITRNISDFLNTDYKDYTKYVISTRALPSL